jgi:hypothetical protein
MKSGLKILIDTMIREFCAHASRKAASDAEVARLLTAATFLWSMLLLREADIPHDLFQQISSPTTKE